MTESETVEHMVCTQAAKLFLYWPVDFSKACEEAKTVEDGQKLIERLSEFLHNHRRLARGEKPLFVSK